VTAQSTISSLLQAGSTHYYQPLPASPLTHLVDDGKSYPCIWWQGLGVVLHHALKACAALEGCLGGVLVLGVHKLTDGATCKQGAKQGVAVGW
jgi:hypothetical protein